ncbi:MAG: hypothetical protein ACUVT7_03140 [Thermoplasmata archaeon]
MASKGVTRTGEVYCLSCYEIVDRSESKCPSCGAPLTEEIRAFLCPKCKAVLALGDAQCRNCGLKFKVKTLKPREPKEDDQFLMRLIEWGKAPGDQRAVAEERLSTVPATPSAEQLRRFAQLKESVRDLMANRSEMLERMERRLEEEKARLAQISSMEGKSASAEQIEAEIMALADEMADITMLQAHMEALSEDISALMDSVDISDAVRERGLAARALRKKLDEKEKELADLRSKEEQLIKREEMVDRKIQAYAQKKKQLDEDEENLKVRLAKLEEERAELERLKAIASGARTESERNEAKARWLEEQKRLREKLSGMKSMVVSHRTGREITADEIVEAEGDLDNMIAGLEEQIGILISEKAELQKKISEATVLDEDIRKLLKVLDQMLGQLPEEIIESFSKSEDFALYERILDRFKI